MEKPKLTENSKRVLVELVTNADVGDRLLAERLGLRKATVASVRKKLHERRLYSVHATIQIDSMTAGSIVLASGTFRQPYPSQLRSDISRASVFPAISPIFTQDLAGWYAIGISTMRPPDLRPPGGGPDQSVLGRTTSVLRRSEFDVNDLLRAGEPDHGLLLSSMLEVTRIGQPPDINRDPWNMAQLSDKEREVLRVTIQNPGLSDFKRSQLTSMSHPTLTKIRRSLSERGILQMIALPNFLFLGFTVYGYYEIQAPIDEFDPAAVGADQMYSLRGPDLCVLVAPLPNYRMAVEFRDALLRNLDPESHRLEWHVFTLDQEETELGIGYQEYEAAVITHTLPDRFGIQNAAREIEDLLAPHLDSQVVRRVVRRVQRGGGTYESEGHAFAASLEQVLGDDEVMRQLDEVDRTHLEIELMQRWCRHYWFGLTTHRSSGHVTRTSAAMIIGQNASMNTLLAELLEETGFRLLKTADPGREAVVAYRDLARASNPPGLVLFDLAPEEEARGAEMVAEIREFDDEATMVIITASLDAQLRSRMTELGAADYLTKPLSRRELREQISRWTR